MTSTFCRVFTLVLVLGAARVAWAVPVAPAAPIVAPHVRAVRTSVAPMIDGRIDDEAWQQAEATSSFTQQIPLDGSPPSDPTTMRVLYDDALYVGFDCAQLHTPPTPHLTRRDRIVEADSVEFDVGTRGDHTSAFEFNVSVSGTQVDANGLGSSTCKLGSSDSGPALQACGVDRSKRESDREARQS